MLEYVRRKRQFAANKSMNICKHMKSYILYIVLVCIVILSILFQVLSLTVMKILGDDPHRLDYSDQFCMPQVFEFPHSDTTINCVISEILSNYKRDGIKKGKQKLFLKKEPAVRGKKIEVTGLEKYCNSLSDIKEIDLSHDIKTPVYIGDYIELSCNKETSIFSLYQMSMFHILSDMKKNNKETLDVIFYNEDNAIDTFSNDDKELFEKILSSAINTYVRLLPTEDFPDPVKCQLKAVFPNDIIQDNTFRKESELYMQSAPKIGDNDFRQKKKTFY